MKKFLSLLMVVCMMMGTVALGEGAIVVQDEQPPVVVTKLNAENVLVAATVCNAQGEAVAEIKDGGLAMTDVSARDTVQDQAVAARLTAAYEGIMDKVHHSQVTCELHEHDVKVDIDAVLGSLNIEIDAHDLVMYELFDVNFGEDVNTLLAEGGYVEMTLQVADYQPLPTVLLYSMDGVEWSVIPYTAAGNKQLTVQLEAPGTLAMLCNGAEAMGIGQETDVTEEPTEVTGETETGNFTPSVSGKLTPDIVPFTGEDGVVYDGTISNVAGDVNVNVPALNYIWVTPVAVRDYNRDIQTHEHLEWAYATIKEAEDIGDLMTADQQATIAADIDATLQQMGLDLTHEQLVVKDLFEVTAYGDYVHYLYDENNYLELTISTDLDPQKPTVVLHSSDSVNWHVHPIEEAEVKADGTMTLRMYDLGTVAILVENPQSMPDGGDMVTAP